MLLGLGQDGMRTDPAPHHMRLALPNGLAVLEGHPTVRRPRHLEDSGSTLNPSNAKARTKALAALKVFNELRYGFPEALLV